MQVAATLKAAGDSHPGLHRPNNEDRYHYDTARGLFIVVDGVGGQAAGEKAAETALTMVRTRLERETGSIEDRIREAITLANNEIHRLASLRAEWQGMACVLTIAVVATATSWWARRRHSALQTARRTNREADPRSLAGRRA